MNNNLPSWSCPKKSKARLDTIISPYRSFIGQSLPDKKQYWTMCGKSASDGGTLVRGCELYQVIQDKLITTYDQFHGVEIDKDIYNANKQLDCGAHWYCGDFYQTLIDNSKSFNPGIVNADLLWMPEYGTIYLSKIMDMLSYLKIQNVLLVGNFILRNRCMTVSPTEIINQLEQQPYYRKAMLTDKWSFGEWIYVYNGTGKNRTVMGSIVFYK